MLGNPSLFSVRYCSLNAEVLNGVDAVMILDKKPETAGRAYTLGVIGGHAKGDQSDRSRTYVLLSFMLHEVETRDRSILLYFSSKFLV